MPKLKGLSEKEKAFCVHYCSNGFNGTQAAIKAGYSDKTARQIATENLSKPYIKNYINELKQDFEQLLAENGITKMAIVSKHWEIASTTIAHLHNTWIERKEFEELTDEQKACISEIDTKVEYRTSDGSPVKIEFIKIKLYNKQAALDSISKILGYDAPVKTDNKIHLDLPVITVSPEQKKLIDGLKNDKGI